MRILIVANGYPSSKNNLNGIFEFDQAKALVHAGHEVIYVAIDMRSIRRWRKWGHVSILKDGVQIESMSIPCGRIPKFILNIIMEFSLSKVYKSIVNRYGKPDIIHSHFIDMGYITSKLFNDTDIPLVHTEHYSGMNQKELSKYHQFLGDNTYFHMDKVFAVSKYLANNIRNKFSIESIVIPNIVDTSNFQYKESNNGTKVFNFVSVGNLLTNKRMDLLIKSFYDAFKDNKQINLYIYGEGPERNNLKVIIEDFNLKDQVFLMGLVDRKVIAKKMQESHCFVLVSKLETFGVAYIEAMSTGLPVIATRCGGPEDFINEDNGMLIDADNQGQLAQALLEMYKNVNIYNKKEISKETIEKFSSNNIAKLLTEEYKKTIRRKIHGD